MADNFNFNFEVNIEIPAGATETLIGACEEAFEIAAGELENRFLDALSSNVWTWDGVTRRGLTGTTATEKLQQIRDGKGYEVSSPRNIWDSGQLAGSMTSQQSKTTASWAWTADYAAAVHDGARIHPFGNKRVTVEIAARPWTKAVLFGRVNNYNGEIYNFTRHTRKYIKKLLN